MHVCSSVAYKSRDDEGMCWDMKQLSSVGRTMGLVVHSLILSSCSPVMCTSPVIATGLAEPS